MRSPDRSCVEDLTSFALPAVRTISASISGANSILPPPGRADEWPTHIRKSAVKAYFREQTIHSGNVESNRGNRPKPLWSIHARREGVESLVQRVESRHLNPPVPWVRSGLSHLQWKRVHRVTKIIQGAFSNPPVVSVNSYCFQDDSAFMPTIAALSRQSKSRASSLCANTEGSGNVISPLTSEA